MDDSVDIKAAAESLQKSLSKLEGALSPLLQKVNRLETEVEHAKSFETDRAKLAAQVDTLKSEAEEREATLASERAAREAEFTELADATTKELDTVIRQLHHALSRESGDI